MSKKNNKSFFTVPGIFLLGFFVFSAGFFPAKAAGGEWEAVGYDEWLASNSIFSSLAFHPTTNDLYIIYTTRSGSSYTPIFRKYDGSNWSDLSTNGLSADTPLISLTFNPRTKEPYVFYPDGQNGDKAAVKKFDGSSWAAVGQDGFSNGQVFDDLELSRVAFHPETNEAYVAYTDQSFDAKVAVKRFDGNSWQNVGGESISDKNSYMIACGFNPSTEELYVAYSDMTAQKIYVKKFDGSSWVQVGSSVEGNDSAVMTLAFHPATGEPHILHLEQAGIDKGVVKKFDGSSWVQVGSKLGIGEAMYMSLAFSPTTNEPWVVYYDDGNYYKAVARRFDGSSWIEAGTVGLDSGDPMLFDLVFNPQTGEPYVTYSDYINEPESSYRVAVKKFNKLLTDTPTLAYNSSKKAKKKITFNFQDLNLKIKKKDAKIRLNGRKIKLSRVRKSGNNVLMASNLKYSKWSAGNYNLSLTYKGKRGKTTYRGTWRANNVLTIN
ncbi:MAG: hypothetical protein UX02_C0006G0003 [Candidatus Moranbacteria bacterium GW2011_GWC1_45_18]|nr:MAG: hypothetical protein UT79_C0001G0003 [Candidatus Moranbacteria bacterium GW2011_GWC2_40_12]KKT32736.1 MAG: hypothetical protein UW19_C0016G0003 [Candidatus Moranbacteria bacterium GW2011_GWF2_44_10]KKT99124.1 MAG: hypothetical protein UX02_C0006G0003 [Candidatus Moranbacteria bacterium GW2011_GWC1_45_18]OGI40632.1 MAG: hypothetical protein A2374_00120 [Candidatus Moranbacteria bacterium RIFOXYB1_FULL_44_23]OGI43032.1 MAG: hypothetical protein A2593_02285 [Candidatus Moranbacteria bacter